MNTELTALSAAVLLLVCARAASAQQFPPGYLDPEPILQAAEAAIGTDRLRCVTIGGSGYSGAVGQQRLNDKNVDWPRGRLENYARTMNWQTGTMKETFEREPGHNPASWKYGLGWLFIMLNHTYSTKIIGCLINHLRMHHAYNGEGNNQLHIDALDREDQLVLIPKCCPYNRK